MTEALDINPTEALVLSEVEQRTTDREILGYFNNFYLSLPSLNGRDFFERTASARGGEEIGWKERVYSTPYFVLGASINNTPLEEKRQKLLKRGYTEKFISQTRAEFLNDVEVALKNAGIDKALLQIQVEQMYGGGTVPLDALAAGSRKLFLPIWIELRKMGYSSIDLWT